MDYFIFLILVMILALIAGILFGINIGREQEIHEHENYLLKGVRKWWKKYTKKALIPTKAIRAT